MANLVSRIKLCGTTVARNKLSNNFINQQALTVATKSTDEPEKISVDRYA